MEFSHPRWPRNGAFLATRNANLTGLTAANWNAVTYVTEVLDADGYFDITTGRYLPTRPGWYEFYGQVRAQTAAGGETPQMAFYKNGATTGFSSEYQGTGGGTSLFRKHQLGCILQLDGVADYVDMRVYLPTGITAVTASAGELTYFMGKRVAD